jgi:transcriptional regulator with XRE-family HTH domain
MPLEVGLNLEQLLREKAPDTDNVELAERLGVSEATVSSYIENRWTVLDRTVMERLADFLQCDAGSLLTTTETRFFDPFRLPLEKEAHRCVYLSRPDSAAVHGGRALAHRDNRAIESVATWLRDFVDRMVEEKHTATTVKQFNEHLVQNCVVIGSPMVNPASEMALCQVFGAEPFNAGDRTKLPFTFKVAATPGVSPSSVLEPSTDGKVGIWLRREKELLQVDVWPAEEFRKLRIKKGRDFAAIVVLNHQPQEKPAHFRKLITLSGFGGVGTEASATALVDRFRDLEPRHDETYVWGVIEVFYKKAAFSTKREILSYRWRCRRGGRCPVDFTRKKP